MSLFIEIPKRFLAKMAIYGILSFLTLFAMGCELVVTTEPPSQAAETIQDSDQAPSAAAPTAPPTDIPADIPTAEPVPTLPPETLPDRTGDNVYGSLAIELVPYDDTVVMPETLGRVTTSFVSEPSGIAFPVELQRESGQFNLYLPPGTYHLGDVQLASLDAEFGAYIFADSFEIQVPEGDCVYVGQLKMSFTLLPPANFAEQFAMAQTLAGEEEAALVLYENGSLVGNDAWIEIPAATDGAETCLMGAFNMEN